MLLILQSFDSASLKNNDMEKEQMYLPNVLLTYSFFSSEGVMNPTKFKLPQNGLCNSLFFLNSLFLCSEYLSQNTAPFSLFSSSNSILHLPICRLHSHC